MEQAIKKAIEGGWRERYSNGVRMPECEEWDTRKDYVLGKNKEVSDYVYQEWLQAYFPKVALDPLFWQALGKAEGWRSFYDEKGMPRIHTTQGWFPDTKDFGSGYDEMMWQAHWHRFIDHLAEGKDVDSFFKELLHA